MLLINKKTLLYGASGHAKVICSIFESMNVIVDSIFDDNNSIKLLNNYKANKKPKYSRDERIKACWLFAPLGPSACAMSYKRWFIFF